MRLVRFDFVHHLRPAGPPHPFEIMSHALAPLAPHIINRFCAARASHVHALAGVLCALFAGCAHSPRTFDAHTLARLDTPFEAPLEALPEAAGVATDFEELVLLAAERDPALRAALLRVRAQTRFVEAASPWPRPTVSYTVFALPVVTRNGPQRQAVSLRVPIAWPGARRAREASARFVASGLSRAHAAQLLVLRRRLAAQYWERWRHHALAALGVQEISLLDGLVSITESRVAAGLASQSELATLALRRALLVDEVDHLHAEAQAIEERIQAEVNVELADDLGSAPTNDSTNASNGAPPDRRTPEVPIVDTPALELIELEALIETSLEHPQLLALIDAQRAEQATETAHRRSRFPDVALRGSYVHIAPLDLAEGQTSGRDALSIGVDVSIPVDASTSRAQAEAAALRADAIEYTWEASRRERQAQITLHYRRLEDLAERLAHFESTTITAASMVDAAIAEFTTEGNLERVLGAMRVSLDVARRKVQMVVDYQLLLAELEALVGAPASRTDQEVDTDDDTSADAVVDAPDPSSAEMSQAEHAVESEVRP